MSEPSQVSQQELPFAEAEGSRDERRNLLGLAIMRVNGDLHLRELMLWIFNVTQGGTVGTFRKTAADIAASPWGLCCSVATARRALQRAAAYRWLVVEQTIAAHGGDGANAYAIDWQGVRATLDTSRRPGSVPALQAAAATTGAPSQIDYPPSQFAHPPMQIDSAFKDTPLSSLHSFTPPPPTPSRPTPAAELGGVAWQAAAAELVVEGVRAVEQMLGAAHGRGMTPDDVLEAVETYRENRSKFAADDRGERVTALCRYLQSGQWPAPGIRTAKELREERRRRAAAAAEREQRRAAEDADFERKLAELEAAHGKTLDRMPEKARDELAVRVLGPAQLLSVYRRGDWRTADGLTRVPLLEALAESFAACSPRKPTDLIRTAKGASIECR